MTTYTVYYDRRIDNLVERTIIGTNDRLKSLEVLWRISGAQHIKIGPTDKVLCGGIVKDNLGSFVNLEELMHKDSDYAMCVYIDFDEKCWCSEECPLEEFSM